MFQLALDRADELTRYLREQRWIKQEQHVVRLESAGEGNMNLVARAVLDNNASLILKQSSPYVHKYPSIAAPEARILSEAAFYRAVAGVPFLAAQMPALLHVAERDRLACLEDLGPASDLTRIYQDEQLPGGVLSALLAWLSALHGLRMDPNMAGGTLRNRDMRALNHAHIFEVPLHGHGAPDLDAITPGLGAAAQSLRADAAYASRVREAGDVYLSDDVYLLHGDFYPGAWLRHPSGVKIIDAEFAFFGRPEFDLGVFMAHLLFAHITLDEVRKHSETYAAPTGFSMALALRFAGIEILRRILGVAQLPLRAGLPQKLSWLDASRELVMQS